MLELAKSLRPDIRSSFVSFSEGGLCRAFLDTVRGELLEANALQHDTPRLLAALADLVASLQRMRADVLCCHGYKANLLGILAARRLGIPVIAVARGWTGECLRVRLYEALDRRVLRWMDKVVCISHAQAEKVVAAGVPADRVAVFCNAVRCNRFGTPDPRYREELLHFFPRSMQHIVGAAGRLSPEKGFGVLVDAAASVVRQDSSVGFVLFGDGPLRDSLRERIESRGIQGNFVLAGFRHDLDDFMPHFDLLTLPSFTEGLPNVVLEAFAAGVPVVATAVGGTPEIVDDGQTGFLVPPGQPAQMANRIRQALSDPSWRREAGVLARETVERRFSFEVQAESYAALFATLLSQANGSRRPRPAKAASHA